MNTLSSTRTICRLFFVAFFIWCSRSPAAISAGKADTAIKAFNTVYWNASNKTFYKQENKTGLLDYWMYAHAWETEMDAYERTRDTTYLRYIRDAYSGFIAMNGTTWSTNSYNDDIAWWILASTRAYQLTRDTAYRAVAKKNFDWMYTSQHDTIWGGGIWWRNTTHTQKNACVNNPMVVAAVNLSIAYADQTYLTKAITLQTWVRQKLYANGQIYDRVENGVPVPGPLSYNHGTFIGASWALFAATKDSVYFKEAIKTADYVRASMCNAAGIMPDEGTSNDAACWKTPFVHHMLRFIIDGKQRQYLAWMTVNADSLWKLRRKTDNLMWYHWAAQAPATGITAQAATGGAALLNLIVLANAATGIACPQNPASPVVFPSVRRMNGPVLLNGRTLTGGAVSTPGMQVISSPEGTMRKYMIIRGKKTGEK